MPPATTTATGSGAVVDDEGPACLSCRHRKLRCSRERPTCAQCEKNSKECSYSLVRQKPGLKAGTIEAIHRRLDQLEHLVARNEKICRHGSTTAGSALASSNPATPSDVFGGASSAIRSVSSGFAQPALPGELGPPPRKRPRLSSFAQHSTSLPAQPIVDAAIVRYFETTHHWIPMVHEGILREKLADKEALPEYEILLHAIVASSLIHADPALFNLSPAHAEDQISRSITAVIVHGSGRMTIQATQAYIILAFEKLGEGDWPTAWSLLGQLARTIECLCLTEEQESYKTQFLRPLQLLGLPRDAGDSEQRRRVFWNVFLLDRLCSVTCGWPTVLTSDKVHRRLPCNGSLWRNRQQGHTPFFGVWDKSQAKLGHSVAYLPTHRVASAEDDPTPATPDASRVDVSDLGAVAYRIEATESLSQISSFFLRQPVDLNNAIEVRDWLTRFMELDLRLVHWKMFLPQRWQDPNPTVSRTESGHMDPNLTLAHITHNTSTVLLHQHIAYPLDVLRRVANLPSSYSAKTCHSAATEIATITARYLVCAETMFVNTEFTFCAFTAAVALLVHSHYLQMELSPHFSSLLDSLSEIARRWNGIFEDQGGDNLPRGPSLADRAVMRLQEYRDLLMRHPSLARRVLLRSAAESLLHDRPLDSFFLQTTFTPQASGVEVDTSPSASGYSMPHHADSGIVNPVSKSSLDGTNLGSPAPPAGYQRGVTDEVMDDGSSYPYILQYSGLPNLMVREEFANVDRSIPAEGTNFDFNSLFFDYNNLQAQ